MKKTFYTILACTAIFTGCKDTILTENGTGILAFNLGWNQEDYSDKIIGVKSEGEATGICRKQDFRCGCRKNLHG